MTDVSDAWSCPRCGATWTRLAESLPNWLQFVRSIQAAHGPACSRKDSLR